MGPTTRGDPESPLRWACKCVRKLAAALRGLGHRVSHQWVAEALRDLGYSLQGNRKTRHLFAREQMATPPAACLAPLGAGLRGTAPPSAGAPLV